MSSITTIGSAGRWMAMAIVALGCSLPGMVATVVAAAEPPPEWDGLLRVPDKGADHLYVRRGVDFAKYSQLQIEPVQIAFDEQQTSIGTGRNPARRLSASDMEQIRATLAREFHSIFENELTRGGYTLTSQDGDNVLRVTPAIVNLYVAGQTRPTSGRGRLYVASSGHMTLVLELRDSVSGQLLARVVDTAHGRRSGNFAVPSTPVATLADARDALTHWAGSLLTALNYAKQSGGTAVAEK